MARPRRGGHCHYIVRQLVPVAGVLIKLRITTRAVNKPVLEVLLCTEKAPTRPFFLLKAPTRAFKIKNLIRHYAKWA